MMRRLLVCFVCGLGLAAGCSRGRQYELKGQVVAINPARQELSIRHDDIRGFMPGMTMAFKVRDARLLEGRIAGDLVTATLVVRNTDAFLSSVAKTGHTPLIEQPLTMPGISPLDVGAVVPDVTLTDESGRERRLSEWRGRTVAVTFVYTRCPLPDFCPRMDRNFGVVQREVLADAGLREHVRLLSVSFDPRFDTPALLAAHARFVGADPSIWQVVSGPVEEIDLFAARFGVSIIREDADLQEIVHNLRTAVIARDGRVVKVFNGSDWKPAELIATLRRAGE